MRKPKVNLCIDIAIFVLFLMLVSTGFLMYLILPSGNAHLSVWGMNRHDWGDIHFWIAAGFLLLIVVHLVLHWNWIVNMLAGMKKGKPVSKKRLSLIFFAILLLLSILIAPFLTPVETGEKERGRGQNIEKQR